MNKSLKRLQYLLLGMVALCVLVAVIGSYVCVDLVVADEMLARGATLPLNFMVKGLDYQFKKFTATEVRIIERYCRLLTDLGEPLGLAYLYLYDRQLDEKYAHLDAAISNNHQNISKLKNYLNEMEKIPDSEQRDYYTLPAAKRDVLDIIAPAGKACLRVGFYTDQMYGYRETLRQWLLTAAGGLLVLALLAAAGFNAVLGRAVDRMVSEQVIETRTKTRADILLEQKKQQQAESRKADDAPLDSNEFFGIIDLAKKVGGTFDLEEILRQTVGAVVRVLGVQEVMVFLVNPGGEELQATIGHDSSGMIEPAAVNDVRVRVGQGEIGTAAEYGGTTIIDTPNPGSAMVAALVARGQVVGVLRAKGKVNGKPFGKRDKLIGRQFADLVGNAIANAMHYRATGAAMPAPPREQA